ncbi:MAG: hypothetical protein H7144_04605 [Burkholderiales bacterium]|nr:hypothetical protein [Phycisphaerae bacterium]
MFTNHIPNHILRVAACSAIALILGAASAGAEPVKNPEYENWAKFKTGAMSKVEVVSAAAGNETKQTIVTKLLEMSPEKAVVEMNISMDMMGTKMDMPAQKREIKAMIDNTTTPTPKPDAGTKLPEVKTSQETVKVGDKEIKCTVAEATSEQNGMKTVSKTWTSPEVPGQMVKTEMKSTGTMDSTVNMKLVEFSVGN